MKKEIHDFLHQGSNLNSKLVYNQKILVITLILKTAIMDKTDNYSLSVDYKAISHVENYIENLFRRWAINEIYLGNIITSFSNLIHLVSEIQGDCIIEITSHTENEEIYFNFNGLHQPILKLFFSEYQLRDIKDTSTQSVFLIQKVADNITVEDEHLILQFSIGALPDEFINSRKTIIEKSSPKQLHKTRVK